MTLFIFPYAWQSQKHCGCKSPFSERDWADGWDHNVISFSVAGTEEGILPSAVLFSVLSQVTYTG